MALAATFLAPVVGTYRFVVGAEVDETCEHGLSAVILYACIKMVELPVDGGKPFHWTVDGRPINLRAPEGKKKGDVVTCRTGSNARMSTHLAALMQRGPHVRLRLRTVRVHVHPAVRRGNRKGAVSPGRHRQGPQDPAAG